MIVMCKIERNLSLTSLPCVVQKVHFYWLSCYRDALGREFGKLSLLYLRFGYKICDKEKFNGEILN